ncbi:putative bifunctional diguanylate cyclase/phosphodiesterase [Enterobacter ludwigii]|uniref:putative bifunctional diguanylate cyclase/phosphodiesterase n=1 Tax=Enterobacter ludwigii TaxID=299767 RepID=UPI003EFAF986
MKRFLFVIIIILLLATGYVSELVQQRQAELQKLTRYTTSWSVSQLYFSYLRFEIFSSEYSHNPDAYSKDEVQLQIDILFSQLDLLTEGMMKHLASEAGKAQSVTDIKDKLHDLSDNVRKGRSGISRNELLQLKRFESVLAEVAALSLAKDIEAVNESNRKIRSLYTYYNYISVSLIFLCIILGGLMLHQNRRLNQSNRRSNRLTNELKAYQIRLEEKNEKLRFEAHHDSLTFLPNRHAFWKDLSLYLNAPPLPHASNKPGLMLFDLDLFKDVNDTYGHDAGDDLLKQMARRIDANRKKNETVYRLGGDEFALLFFDLDEEHARKMALDYRALIKKPFSSSGNTLHVDASFGIAIPQEDTGPDILYKRADIALYEAKMTPSASVVFFKDEMLKRIVEERFIERELTSALEKKEMMVFYQPIFSISSGKIVSYEVLARWLHPVRGFISPVLFIPIAERTGLIHDLGEWILNSACEEISRLDTAVSIAVNVSPLQLRNEGFENMLTGILARNNIPSSQLELEITETSLLIDDNRTMSILNTLHDAGISISLDDFGTGFSSLSRLSSFPFDKIKIDRSFISALEDKKSSINIIKSIVEVGKSLNMQVVAEGIENDRQLEHVKALGCDFVQGYLLGKPERFPVSDN